MKRVVAVAASCLCVLTAALWAHAGDEPGESGALPRDRLEQADVAAGRVSRRALREAGLAFFTTPMNRHDGYGDGPLDASDTVGPGGRPTLQGNGTFLRVNGLDAQTCLECHSVVSHRTTPPSLGIGGAGGSNSNAIIAPTKIDPADLEDKDGKAGFDGRFANPPAVFGAGAIELIGLEMTADLQALAQKALDNPGVEIALVTKGVHFGVLTADANGDLDFSGMTGVDEDLVVKPFGRKGEFPTMRSFDVGAFQFHFGMQPTEIVGEDEDADGDGVKNEIRPGDLSALGVFLATLERPFMESLSGKAKRGFATFEEIGCADCHRPYLTADRHALPLRFPEVPAEPWRNVFYEVDLTRAPANFARAKRGGIVAPFFSDLRRHDMGEGLKEDFALADEQRNREFVTARLWGVADTAPYLHDGRATTLTDAILAHGGEAQTVRDAFAALPGSRRVELLRFLRSLRTPKSPVKDLLQSKKKKHRSGRR